jgi:hypothetical protein
MHTLEGLLLSFPLVTHQVQDKQQPETSAD